MTTTASPSTTHVTVRSAGGRNYARAGGLFYLLTFAASIPALLMLHPILHDSNYIVGAGHDTQVAWACFLDFVTALAGIGSAVAVYPIVKRANNSLALGFVMSRTVEAAVIMIGVVALLGVVTMRQDFAGSAADTSSLTTTGHALVDVRDWTFVFGPTFMASINAVLFGTLLYRSGLVPRIIPTIGLIGAPLLFTSSTLILLGHNTIGSDWTKLATAPVAAWELSVGFYMTVKGFKRTPYNETTA
jgi:hypothetical protein